MTEQEGVIKYRLDYQPSKPCHYAQFDELNAWRTILTRLELIGQNPKRYGGLGFGNISFRVEDSAQFVITGSQTGGLKYLYDEDFSRILSADPRQNHIIADGAMKPSSEALTHAAVYTANPSAKAVVHVHNPDIWQHYQALDLPAIDAAIAYGTPAMAAAVAGFFRSGLLTYRQIFVMLGHEDGVVAFGDTIASASQALIAKLAIAMQMAPDVKNPAVTGDKSKS